MTNDALSAGPPQSPPYDEIQALVSQGNYHDALQRLGRPSFTPGDGSWTEWAFIQMHTALIDPAAPTVDHPHVLEFLHQIAALPQLSVDEHEHRWNCYKELCVYFQRPIVPSVYHTTFLQTSPKDLAISLTSSGDLLGLDILLLYFSMGCTILLQEMPPTIVAKDYSHLIPWQAEGVQDFLKDHIRIRFEQTGQILDWMEVLKEELGTECDLFCHVMDDYGHLVHLEYPEEQQELTMHATDDDLLATNESTDASISIDLVLHTVEEKLLIPEPVICPNVNVVDMDKHQQSNNNSNGSSSIDYNDMRNEIHELKDKVTQLQLESENKDRIIQELQSQMEAMQQDHEYHKTADQARMDYLLSSKRPIPNLGGEERNATDEEVQQLAYALEVSERQRAQALDALEEQRDFYADKMKHLQEAFRRMVHAEEDISTPMAFGKRHI